MYVKMFFYLNNLLLFLEKRKGHHLSYKIEIKFLLVHEIIQSNLVQINIFHLNKSYQYPVFQCKHNLNYHLKISFFFHYLILNLHS